MLTVRLVGWTAWTARLVAGTAFAAAGAGLAAGQHSASSPSITTQRVADAQRLADLLALIDGPNPPQARLTGARELLRLEAAETPARLLAILRGASPPARTAVAAALAGLPQYLSADYVEPLVDMLNLSDEQAVRAAAAALAAFDAGQSIAALHTYALDPTRAALGRVEAIRALGQMPQREAAAALVELLDVPEPEFARIALAALERATGVRFAGDAAAAHAWWNANRDAAADRWQQSQIRRLLEQQRQADASVAQLEARLSSSFRELYARTPDAERPAVLTSYLGDPVQAVRLLALELVQADVTEGRALSTDTVAAVRALLADPAPAVRAASVRTIAALRSADDAEFFLSLLDVERDVDVRLALVRALGFIGDRRAVPALLRLLANGSPTITGATVAALGRLAERSALDDDARAALVPALLQVLESAPHDATELRERTLWAMSRLADPHFAEVFIAALDPAQAATVRQAAVSGLVGLADPRFNAALIPATRDPDAVVRQSAVDALGRLARDDADFAALWDRLAPAVEPDETIRETAWVAILRLLQARPLNDIEALLDRIPGNGEQAARRAIDLLQLLEARLVGADDRGRRGLVSARRAEHHARLGALDAALAAYLSAVDDLHAAANPELTRVVVGLINCALKHDRYDARIASALAALNSPLDAGAIWDGVRREIERRIDLGQAERALAMLRAFREQPPVPLSQAEQRGVDELLARALRRRAETESDTLSAAITQLQFDPGNEAARAAILQFGPRAAPAVCEALLAVLDDASGEPAFEQLLRDLLQDLLPDWPGYAAEDPPAAKRAAVVDAPHPE